MPAHFVDSSALVKRYMNEIGSAWLRGVVQPGGGYPVYIASITGVEVASAVARRHRSGSISAANAATILTQFRHDFVRDFRIITISSGLLIRAMGLAEIHALRGYDAVQLAVAIEVKARCDAVALALTLLSADVELIAAAAAEGLTTDDPNAHP